MTPPLFRLSESQTKLGEWNGALRTLELSRPFLLNNPWLAAVEVLKHEMAHQYVEEILKVRREPPHGPTFQKICHERGIDANAAGSPAVPPPPSEHTPSKKLHERILHLLALAKSPNPHEAEAAAVAAQRLMLKYNITVLQSGQALSYSFRQLGQPKRRVFENERLLSLILTKHFFVEAIWVPVYLPHLAKRATVLEIMGTHENLELAEYIHTFLTYTSEQLWKQQKRQCPGIHSGQRQTFLAGVMNGFLDKLSSSSNRKHSLELVQVKNQELTSFSQRRYPAVERVRYKGQTHNEVYAQGKDVGSRIVLFRAIQGETRFQGKNLPVFSTIAYINLQQTTR
ncbi:hypothetical protein BCY86_05445 [Pajaroellobacter abortibovis]|uniref:DUF2786 domain-containing protein n=2 Tax=Pajaroellobacter abortibovis TaxID=1882918 RepID=A0A1L6MZS3_9BACT|nr:hypothetical protein BCY86_05445 [Pajaroellobacter abortibovis]